MSLKMIGVMMMLMLIVTPLLGQQLDSSDDSKVCDSCIQAQTNNIRYQGGISADEVDQGTLSDDYGSQSVESQ